MCRMTVAKHHAKETMPGKCFRKQSGLIGTRQTLDTPSPRAETRTYQLFIAEWNGWEICTINSVQIQLRNPELLLCFN